VTAIGELTVGLFTWHKILPCGSTVSITVKYGIKQVDATLFPFEHIWAIPEIPKAICGDIWLHSCKYSAWNRFLTVGDIKS
jgi:hypothetical protein